MREIQVYKGTEFRGRGLRASKHWAEERNERLGRIRKLEKGRIVQIFIEDDPEDPNFVDKIYIMVLSNGVMIYVNSYTYEVVTMIIARPNQVLRCYKAAHLYCPQYLLDVCRENVKNGLNDPEKKPFVRHNQNYIQSLMRSSY